MQYSSLLEMSFSGAILISVVVVVRAVTINRLPKRTFLALWGIVLFRLLVPFSFSSGCSVYTLANRAVPAYENAMHDTAANALPAIVNSPVLAEPAGQNAAEAKNAFPVWYLLWCAGAVLCGCFFAVSYLRCRMEFRNSLPVSCEFVQQWLKEHPTRRPVAVRQSDRISTPLTYGFFRPVILMPKKTDWENTEQLQYVLLHEYVHIRRFDAVIKLPAVLALCMHWCNPLVWVMFFLFNRDIELACDERVVRYFGEDSKAAYAHTLIDMEAEMSGLLPLCNSFSKSAIEERIRAIMKMKKRTLGALLFSVVLLAVVMILFATSAEKEPETDGTRTENFAAEGGAAGVGEVSDDFDVPAVVLEQAKAYAAAHYDRTREIEPEADYQNWRIDSLAYSYTYEDFDGKELEIYLMNHTFLAGTPEKVILAGGRSMDEEGWVVPDYPNSHYLVFERNGEELTFLTPIFENDCFPGDEIFTADLRLLLMQDEPRFTVSADALSYRGITYGQFRERGGGEAEFLQSVFFFAPVPGKNLDIVFMGTYDQELAGPVLSEDDSSVRLSGKLGEMVEWVMGDYDVEAFVSGLAWNEENQPEYRYAEGAGTTYYVGNRYLIVEFDSDGDAVRDAVLEISLDESEQIDPDSYAWLY